MDINLEQQLLKTSIAVTAVVGVVGIASGLLTQSDAIVFDGMYSLVDMVLTVGSLTVARYLALGGSRRFQFGYWHLEPMVEAFGGSMLALSCLYAAFNGISGLMAGGAADVAYGFGAAWAGVLSLIGLSMWLYIRRHARRMESGLLSLDARSWLVSGLLSIALLIGFAIAIAMAGTAFSPWIRYVDSTVLLCIAIAMLPMPMRATWHALNEIMQVAPGDLDREVKQVMDAIIKEYGFLDYSSAVAKVGRARFVEIHVLVPEDYAFGAVAQADAIRRDVSARLQSDSPRYWLTLDFTADPSWI